MPTHRSVHKPSKGSVVVIHAADRGPRSRHRVNSIRGLSLWTRERPPVRGLRHRDTLFSLR